MKNETYMKSQGYNYIVIGPGGIQYFENYSDAQHYADYIGREYGETPEIKEIS
jgi:hypothetical protein